MAGVVALIALVATEIRDGVRLNWRCAVAAPHVVRGFVHGLQYRDPVRPEVSRFDRMNYWKFAPPWRLSGPPGALLHALPREIIRQRVSGGREPEPTARANDYYARRKHVYPDEPAVLEI